jgi:hypothetical protein
LLFGLGGPVVHLAHDRPLAAGLSLAARVVVPVGAVWLAYKTTDCHEVCGTAALGFVVSMLTVSLVDVSLANTRDPAPAAGSQLSLGFDPRRRALALGGAF